MRPLTHWFAAMLLVVTSLGAAAQPDERFRASGANAGLPSRYRVHLALQPGDELETIIRQLTATYGGRLEPYAEVGFEGFMLVVSETRGANESPVTRRRWCRNTMKEARSTNRK